MQSFSPQSALAAVHPLFLLLFAALVAFSPDCNAGNVNAGDAAAPSTAVHGKLESRTTTVDGVKQVEYFVAVGNRRYTLTGDADALAPLPKLRRKWITVSGESASNELDAGLTNTSDPAKTVQLSLSVASADDIAVQKPQAIIGVVKVAGSGRKAIHSIVAADRTYGVANPKDTRKLAAFAGKNIACTGQLAADDHEWHASELDSVERKLLPGEREPANEREAIAGAWKGQLDVLELPSSSGNARKGLYPIELEVDEKVKAAKGKVFDLYAVDSIRIRKFRAKTRAIEFDLNYTLPGGGTYTLLMTGSFDDAWRKLSGTWKSSFLGSGTFDMAYR